MAQWVKNLPAMQETQESGFDPWVFGKMPWRRKWQPTPVFLPEKSHGQRSLVGHSLRGHKQQDMTKQPSTHLVIWLHQVPIVAHRSLNFHCSLPDIFS